MWITKVQLSDIKSYAKNSPAIEFRPGVNLIQGHNGAGKSTLLEAIGVALFDSRPYTNPQFVREGARSGTITVGFMSALDDREYEVVRAVGASAFYIYDPVIRQKLCEGKDDTFAFIRRHLQVEPDTELAGLFQDAIGVPQGTMTGIFLETAGTRKAKFDRLLGIDSYERVWTSLRDTASFIDRMIGDSGREIAELQGMLVDLPGVQAEVERLENLVGQGLTERQARESAIGEVSESVQAFDRTKAQIDQLAGQLAEFATDLARLEERARQARAETQSAEEAAAILAESAAGFEAYTLADETLKTLEPQQKARALLLDSRRDLETARQLGEQEAARLETQLEGVVAAEAEVRRLEPLVEQQAALEAELARLQDATFRHRQLESQLRQTAQMRADLDFRLARSRQRAVEEQVSAEAAPPAEEAGAGDDFAELASQLREGLAGLENELTQVAEARQAAGHAESALAEARLHVTERTNGQEELRRIEADLAAARERLADARLEVRQGEQARQQLEAHQTLLDGAEAVCPVCHQPLNPQARAESAAHFAAEQARLDESLARARATETDSARAVAALDGQRQTLAARIESLPSEASLEAAEARARQTADALHARRVGAGRDLALVEARFQRFDRSLVEAQAALDELAGAIGHAAELQVQIEALADPRRARDRALDRAAERLTIEPALAAARANLEAVRGQFDDLNQQLAVFEGLDEALEAARRDRELHGEAYRRTLAHQTAAAQLQARRAALEGLTGEIAAREAARQSLVQERDGLLAGYDAAAHDARRLEQTRLQVELGQIQARLDEHQHMLYGMEARRADLLEKQQALERLQAEVGRLQARKEGFEFVRGAIRGAGPRIAEQLVQLIGEQANRTFGDILGDYSLTLNWSKDYAISVNAAGETRAFELLSGGEQMIAAMAVRLALLTQLASVRFAFFDEPTANLDETRREQLAQRLSEIRSLQQLFVISHDDTFEQESYHVVQVRKENGLSQVEIL